MVVALSGKCCSGKNYIASTFVKNGFIHIDVDVLSSEVFLTLTDKIIKLFGEVVSNEDGTVNRKAVGEIVFNNPDRRRDLENLIHPAVYKRVIEIVESNPDNNYLVNIPILKDSILIDYLDAIVWIKSPILLRIFRTLKRDNYGLFTVLGRIYAQKNLSVKHLAKHLSIKVDIYYIYNSWFSIGLQKSISRTIDKLKRGYNVR